MTMTLIETITVGSGGAASIEFTGIAGDGVDLFLVLSARADNTSPGVEVTFNSDTTDYSNITLRGLTPSVSSVSGTGGSRFDLYANRSGDTANTFSSNSLYISNYTSAAAKPLSLDAVYENNATFAAQYIAAGLWNDTAAVTSIQVAHTNSNFVENTSASLYIIS